MKSSRTPTLHFFTIRFIIFQTLKKVHHTRTTQFINYDKFVNYKKMSKIINKQNEHDSEDPPVRQF